MDLAESSYLIHNMRLSFPLPSHFGFFIVIPLSTSSSAANFFKLLSLKQNTLETNSERKTRQLVAYLKSEFHLL